MINLNQTVKKKKSSNLFETP